MKVEIDLDVLKEAGITADDFTYVYLLYNKSFHYLNNLNLKPSLTELQSKSFIKIGESLEKHTVRQEFIDLFASDFDTQFLELVNNYPMKVNSPNRGIRVLRARDPQSKANLRAKEKYKRVLEGKPYKHKQILRCLDTQLAVEKNNLGYLQTFEVWINNHTWEKYEDLNEHETENGEKGKRPRITRTL
jgi:hypothetical protein